MVTIKHVAANGQESIRCAERVDYIPDRNELIGYGGSGPGKSAEVHVFNSGRVYVMNDGGKTVGAYVLSK